MKIITDYDFKSMKIDAKQIYDYSLQFNYPLNEFKINNPIRLSHFFCQVLNESNKLKITENTDLNSKIFENRIDLGNTQEGDGVKYKPRGFLPLVGKNCYLAYSKYTNKPYMLNPSPVSNNDVIVHATCWNWSYKRDTVGNSLNELADLNNFLKICFIIDGGIKFKSLKPRIILLKQLFEIFQVKSRTKLIQNIKDECFDIISNKKTLRENYEYALKSSIQDKKMFEFIFKDL